MMINIFNNIWDFFFKTKVRAFIVWYVVAYLIAIFKDVFRFHWMSMYIFFPIKLVPLFAADVFSEAMYIEGRSKPLSVKMLSKKLRRWMYILLIGFGMVTLIFKTTGLKFGWLLI
ncbi:MAG: hypothetical protein K6F01_09055 [Selenomonas sp.]|uniref:hypothetical protein n=1 Tax=Selenomonas sp. TaxID=2053611 RepID=UPI0025FE6977|nr:hypothetical protein [Selenomonas sp.]MCR5439562.1 hypothetical protein [Selenomonas sp.]